MSIEIRSYDICIGSDFILWRRYCANEVGAGARVEPAGEDLGHLDVVGLLVEAPPRGRWHDLRAMGKHVY